MDAETNHGESRGNSRQLVSGLTEGTNSADTQKGQPLGELSTPGRRRFVRAEAAIEHFRTAPPVDYERLRHDLADIITD
ncbi:hypothetical protein [Candidatus Poriferisocius sp.]|uniref:hypothetical protein n=1 Tax=Candidatus Poriferisocius sp. TaxID=3101276 RepID=UPI003B5B59A2